MLNHEPPTGLVQNRIRFWKNIYIFDLIGPCTANLYQCFFPVHISLNQSEFKIWRNRAEEGKA